MSKDLTAVAPELDLTNNPKPESTQKDLAMFLLEYDCTVAIDKDACYTRTRLVLLKMSRRIDYLAGRLYVAKASIGNLTNNLSSVISNMQNVKMPEPKK